MSRDDNRQRYLDGLKKRNNRSHEFEVKVKRQQSMIKTMAKKFPIEERSDYNRVKFNSSEYKENMAKSVSESWKYRDRISIGKKMSESLKKSKEQRSKAISKLKWWNDGTKNVRTEKCPGPEWKLGRFKYVNI